MAWAYIIRSSDRKLFKKCRRAWDFGSRSRQNLEPRPRPQVFDFKRAVRDALALYYFPGMWEWNRVVVLPQALKGFQSSMEKQRAAYEKEFDLTENEKNEWIRHFELGEDLLRKYFQWSPLVDEFTPIRVETDFDVNIPDPRDPGTDLVIPDPDEIEGHLVPVRFRGLIDMLVMDDKRRYWIIEHRLVEREFTDTELLMLDEQSTAYCWAWEEYFLGMKIKGVIFNELCFHPGSEKDLTSEEFETKRKYIKRTGNEFFRRTKIPKSRRELKDIRQRIAGEALDITAPDLRLYPHPSEDNCRKCVFREPCLAMNENADFAKILETKFQKRTSEEFERGRIGGSTFSTNRGGIPPKF